MDRTPLQRMMLAALLHSMRDLPLYPPAPEPSREPGARTSVFGDFMAVGKLPRDPFENGGTRQPDDIGALWHGEAAREPLEQEHLDARDAFAERFKKVRRCFLGSCYAILGAA